MTLSAMSAVFVQTLKDAVRSKWLLTFTVLFFFYAFNLPFLSFQILQFIPKNYMARFMQIIISTSFSLIPLLALPLGARSIVEDRESGFLQYMLATPISRGQFLLSRFAGLFTATTFITFAGFSIAALVAFQLSPSSIQIWYVTAVACILNGAMLGIALVISVICKRGLTAFGISILTWLVFIYVLDTNLSAPILNAADRMEVLVPWILSNPVESSRLLAIMSMNPGISDLGATGMALDYVFHSGAATVLWLTMLVWIAVSVMVAYLIFVFQDIK